MAISANKTNLDKTLWIAGACLVCFSAFKLIVEGKLFWAAVPAIPLLALLAIRAPFIFPFGAYAFLIPFDPILSITGHDSGATLTKVLGILTIMTLLLKGTFERRFIRSDKAIFWWIFLSLYAACSALWALDSSESMTMVPTVLGLATFYLVVSFYRVEEKEWNTLKLAILLGGFFAAALSIYQYFSGDYYGANTTRATLMLGNRETNPNSLGFCMLIPSSICIEMLTTGKKFDLKKMAYILIFATLLLCVIVSGSRETILGLGIIFAVYLLSSKRKITVGLILTAISLPVIFLMMQTLTDRWQDAYETGGDGRFDIWRVGIKALGSFWLTGAGLENFPMAYTKFVDYNSGFAGFFRASHNVYLNLAVEFGLAGVVALLWGLKRHYTLIRSNYDPEGKDKIMLTAVFWAILEQSFFGDFFWDKSTWLLWMMVLIYANTLKYGKHGVARKGLAGNLSPIGTSI